MPVPMTMPMLVMTMMQTVVMVMAALMVSVLVTVLNEDLMVEVMMDVVMVMVALTLILILILMVMVMMDVMTVLMVMVMAMIVWGFPLASPPYDSANVLDPHHPRCPHSQHCAHRRVDDDASAAHVHAHIRLPVLAAVASVMDEFSHSHSTIGHSHPTVERMETWTAVRCMQPTLTSPPSSYSSYSCCHRDDAAWWLVKS